MEICKIYLDWNLKRLFSKIFLLFSDREIKLGVMERKLLLTYDPSEIKSLLNQLKERMDRKAIISLSEKVMS